MDIHHISAAHLEPETVGQILENGTKLALSDDARSRIAHCREYLDNKVANLDKPIYGINTGFGSLYDQSISKEDLGALQKNLVMSHACGTGEEVPEQIVKIMLLLKAQGLSYGHSGVQVETVEMLIEFFNRDILPVVYQQGSLGASGDLAPLAHLTLPIIGMGEVNYKGERRAAAEVLEEEGLSPVELKSKEGLALLNGTQFMSSFGLYCILNAEHLLGWADTLAAISLDAYDGRIEPFDPLIHEVRKQSGQAVTAARIRELLDGSEMIARPKQHVQDPYSFRCVPQVHGASRDLMAYVRSVIVNEINSVTDNPTVFPDEDKVISAGNFHGQPLALAMDSLAIAMAEIASISERRVYKLISGQRGLPAFLVANPGLNSGFMIPQYSAASLVSQNKQLCTPASVDTIDSSNGQEDHVSMGANAATKAYRVLRNLEGVLAVEIFNASQAMHFREERSSETIETILADFREVVPVVEEDKVMFPEMETARLFLRGTNV